jgi:hypothetical protein
VFKEHIITCFITDEFGVESRSHMNMDQVTWECDFPHSDSTWPTSPEQLAKQLDGISDDDVERITHRNAMRAFSFDPFGIRPRERCTVGALRAEAAGHDISVRSFGKKVAGDTTAAGIGAFVSNAAAVE